MNTLNRIVHQVGSIYKRVYRDAPSTKHKKNTCIIILISLGLQNENQIQNTS
jgi:hypothetical protein